MEGFPHENRHHPLASDQSRTRTPAESVLHEGETLSSFVEQSLRISIDHRWAQQAFIARALAARDEAKRTGDYFAADEVLRELDEMHANVRSQAGK